MQGNAELSTLMETLPLLKKLDEQSRRKILSAATEAAYAPGQIVSGRGTECSGLVVVKSGQLRAFYETEDGKEVTLFRLLSGDVCILSANCVLKNITFEVTLESEKESSVYRIPAAVWGKLGETSEAVRQFSMELVSERFSEVMWVMEQMVSRNMGQRVAAFLMEQSVLEGTKTLRLTHDTIARNLATAREVISRTLKYLEGEGLLKLSRGVIELTDTKRLRELGR